MRTLMLASMLVAAATLTGCGKKAEAPPTEPAATPATTQGAAPGTSANTEDAEQGGGEKLGGPPANTEGGGEKLVAPPASSDGGGEKLVEPAPTAE